MDHGLTGKTIAEPPNVLGGDSPWLEVLFTDGTRMTFNPAADIVLTVADSSSDKP